MYVLKELVTKNFGRIMNNDSVIEVSVLMKNCLQLVAVKFGYLI